jgi:hypothetical protein
LDADDFMLPDRFKQTSAVLAENPSADGVYEAVGVKFEADGLRETWLEKGLPTITTTTCKIPPEDLFLQQEPIGSCGYAHTNGWTVKRSFLSRSGLFNPVLTLHQDTELFVRFALVGCMYAGEIVKPVAMRRLHSDNRITQPRSESESFFHRIRMWCSLWRWAKQHGYQQEARVILERMAKQCRNRMSDNPSFGEHILGVPSKYKTALAVCEELSPISLMDAVRRDSMRGLVNMFRTRH